MADCLVGVVVAGEVVELAKTRHWSNRRCPRELAFMPAFVSGLLAALATICAMGEQGRFCGAGMRHGLGRVNRGGLALAVLPEPRSPYPSSCSSFDWFFFFWGLACLTPSFPLPPESPPVAPASVDTPLLSASLLSV